MTHINQLLFAFEYADDIILKILQACDGDKKAPCATDVGILWQDEIQAFPQGGIYVILGLPAPQGKLAGILGQLQGEVHAVI